MAEENISKNVANGAETPCVGIFWHVDGTMVADRWPLANAEHYGDFLTSRGHYEVWETWRRKGERWLQQNHMPVSILICEYEEFPRGRIVYDIHNDLFVIYADRRLQGSDAISAIVRLFGLESSRTDIRSDGHYR